MRRRLTTLALGVVGAALLLGSLAPRLLIPDSLEPFRSDPRSFAVAVKADAATRHRTATPWGRLLLPARRVSVWVETRRCPADGAGRATPDRAYVARVQFYTLFAIPGPAADVSCGGTQVRWASPREVLVQRLPARQS